MKKGFTLMELLVVIVVVSVVTASATISFMNIDSSVTNKDLKNKYIDIQKSASIYVDLNDTWLSQFTQKKEMFITLEELKNTNYISSSIVNPVTNEEIPSNYSVKLYIATDETTSNEFVDSCIVDITKSGETEIVKCIANSQGEACECCDYKIDSTNNKTCK